MTPIRHTRDLVRGILSLAVFFSVISYNAFALSEVVFAADPVYLSPGMDVNKEIQKY